MDANSGFHPRPQEKQKPRNHCGYGVFWSCYPDLNWGPHPYQLALTLFASCGAFPQPLRLKGYGIFSFPIPWSFSVVLAPADAKGTLFCFGLYSRCDDIMHPQFILDTSTEVAQMVYTFQASFDLNLNLGTQFANINPETSAV